MGNIEGIYNLILFILFILGANFLIKQNERMVVILFVIILIMLVLKDRIIEAIS